MTSTAADASPAALTTLKVGVVPIVDVAPLYVGSQKGFFKANGLSIKPTILQGGATVITALQSGSLQFGFGNETSLSIAASQGLPICIVSEGDRAGTNVAKSYTQVLVKANSGITSMKQLAGKTVAVNDLDNVGPLSVNTAMKKAGGNPASLRYTEIGFPDMNAALAKGSVAAIFQTEPFVTAARTTMKVRSISAPLIATKSNYTISAYFTTKGYAKAHPAIVKAFKKSIVRSLSYSQAHLSAVRGVVPSYTGVAKSVAQKMFLPTWSPTISTSSLQLTIKLAKQYGYLKKAPSVSSMLCK